VPGSDLRLARQHVMKRYSAPSLDLALLTVTRFDRTTALIDEREPGCIICGKPIQAGEGGGPARP
jgi:hypothetical protein